MAQGSPHRSGFIHGLLAASAGWVLGDPPFVSPLCQQPLRVRSDLLLASVASAVKEVVNEF